MFIVDLLFPSKSIRPRTDISVPILLSVIWCAKDHVDSYSTIRENKAESAYLFWDIIFKIERVRILEKLSIFVDLSLYPSVVPSTT